MREAVPLAMDVVFPYAGLPAFAARSTREAGPHNLVERYRHGAGDIWRLKGFDPPDYQIVTPGTDRAGADTKLVEYDYYLAFVIHLIREAVGVDRPVRITRAPWNGMIGNVVELPEAPQVVGSGLRVASAKVRLPNERIGVVPLANLELLG